MFGGAGYTSLCERLISINWWTASPRRLSALVPKFLGPGWGTGRRDGRGGGVGRGGGEEEWMEHDETDYSVPVPPSLVGRLFTKEGRRLFESFSKDSRCQPKRVRMSGSTTPCLRVSLSSKSSLVYQRKVRLVIL